MDPIPAGIDRSISPDFLPPAGGVENKPMTEKIEYRVRMVPRYIVTRYHEFEGGRAACGSETRGQYDNADVAYEVATALCKAEHERLGWDLGDERIQYPLPYEQDQERRAGLVAGVTLAGSGDVRVSPGPIYKG